MVSVPRPPTGPTCCTHSAHLTWDPWSSLSGSHWVREREQRAKLLLRQPSVHRSRGRGWVGGPKGKADPPPGTPALSRSSVWSQARSTVAHTLLHGWAPGLEQKGCWFPESPSLAVSLSGGSSGPLPQPSHLAHPSFPLQGG